MQEQMKLQIQVSKYFYLVCTMGRVGAMTIRCTHRCRLFYFCFVLFDCCVSLLLPSIHDDICEFLVTFGKGERGEYSIFP